MKNFEESFSIFDENENVDNYEENSPEDLFGGVCSPKNEQEGGVDDDLPEIPDLEE